MLKLKKLNPAIIVLGITQLVLLNARAAAEMEPPAAAQTPAAAPAAPAQPELAKGEDRSITEDELAKLAHGLKFQAKKDGKGFTHLVPLGFVKIKCAQHMHVKLERPSVIKEKPTYALSFTESDLVDSAHPENVIAKTSVDCSSQEASICKRHDPTCVPLSAISGASEVMATPLTFDSNGKGKRAEGTVVLRVDDMSKDERDETAISRDPISEAYGGPFTYKTPALEAAEARAQEEADRNQLLVSACEDAVKSSENEKDTDEDTEATLNAFERMLNGTEVEKYRNVIAAIKDNRVDTDFEMLDKKIHETTSLDKLEKLIGEVYVFGKQNKDIKDFKERAIALLLEIGQQGVQHEAHLMNDGSMDANKFTNDKLILGEHALLKAHLLDPKNSDIYARYEKAVLIRAQFAAGTGNAQYYNMQTQEDVANAYQAVMTDPQLAALRGDFQRAMAGQGIAYKGPDGTPYAYGTGTSLDAAFNKAETANVQRQIQAEQRRQQAEYRATMQEIVQNYSAARMNSGPVMNPYGNGMPNTMTNTMPGIIPGGAPNGMMNGSRFNNN